MKSKTKEPQYKEVEGILTRTTGQGVYTWSIDGCSFTWKNKAIYLGEGGNVVPVAKLNNLRVAVMYSKGFTCGVQWVEKGSTTPE